ncbi:PT repeat family protein [Colletotrichum tofieldiae]|nr:PT repeat family protein [Colletotrichum tofieldiae]GKT80876.1 PT repeat family protein [Colletotrichum tofieldiae]GKT88296.1 PT repeat family protein [Colletotrichum tofieldiae]
MVSLTITYKKPGTQPPIFVAGSFSDPEWQPQEMQFTTEDGGEHTFHKNIEVPPSTQIQYKFRVGLGDWWVLNEDAPTAPESQEYKQLNGDDGEQAAKASESMEASKAAAAQSASQLEPKPKIIDHLKDEERQRLSSTPIEQVADTAAEVADSAAKLDAEEDTTRLAPLPKGVGQLKDEERKRLSSTPIEQVASVAAEVADSAQKLDADEDLEERDNADDGPPPLFAHEALGPYEPSGSDDDDDSKGLDHHGTVEYDVDKYDLNDPTLERWPSNRNGIIDAVRNVETGRNEDHTTFHGAPLSPVIGSRKAGLDHYYEEAVLSSGPSSPGSTKRLELPRKSHGSMVSDRSLLSLGSIAEEDKETPNAEEANRENDGLVRVPSPAIRPTPNPFTSPASDEDEGVVMKGSKAKPKKSSESERSELPHVNGESNGKHPMDLSSKASPAQPDSPSIHVEPPEQAGESSNGQHDDQAKSVAFNPTGSASTTGRDDGHKGQIKKRGASSTERPGTPSSIHSVTDSKGGWLQAFFRVLFVDWIGGLFSRLFGSKRKA